MAVSLLNGGLVCHRIEFAFTSEVDFIVACAQGKRGNFENVPESGGLPRANLRHQWFHRRDDDIISGVGFASALTRYNQPSTMSTTHYVEALVSKSLGCGEVSDEYALNEIFIDGLPETVRHSMRWYWITHPRSTMYDLLRYATALRTLQKKTGVHSEKGSEHR